MGGVGGFKRYCKVPFTEFAKKLPELDPGSSAHAEALWYRQGLVPDLMLDATSIDFSENLAKKRLH